MSKKFPRLNFDLMQPYALQREIIESEARFKIVAFGRQSGKSWLAKREALKKGANEGKRVWWVAPTMTAAADHWADLLKLIEDSGFPTKSINRSTKTIEFLSGGSIRIRSAEIPDNLRGGTLDFLILDEAAFMREEVWTKILQATITASRGSVLFLSTPNGQNWFYKLYRLGENPAYPMYQSWTMPSTAAPYQDKELLEIIRKTVPEMVWREEYLAEFLADAGGVFVGLDRFTYQPMLTRPLVGHTYIAGVDWGLDDDYTTFTVVDKYERRQVFGVRFNSIGTIEQIDRITEYAKIWQPEVIHIEKNGVGEPMFRIFKERITKRLSDGHSHRYDWHGTFAMNGGRTVVRGVHMNNQIKRRIIERLAADIEFQRFTPLVAESDNDVESYGAIQVAEMSTFARRRTASGLEITYGALEGYHDDTVMGLALCNMGLDPYEDVADQEYTPKQAQRKRTNKRSPFRRQMTGRENTRRNRRSRRIEYA